MPFDRVHLPRYLRIVEPPRGRKPVSCELNTMEANTEQTHFPNAPVWRVHARFANGSCMHAAQLRRGRTNIKCLEIESAWNASTYYRIPFRSAHCPHKHNNVQQCKPCAVLGFTFGGFFEHTMLHTDRSIRYLACEICWYSMYKCSRAHVCDVARLLMMLLC